MTIVVGVSPDRRGRPALDLAALLARSAEDDLVLCTIVPRPWPPSPAKVDAEYRAELERVATEALDAARARIPTDIAATTLVHSARSVPSGLLEVAEEHDARVLVLGSSSAGVFGRVSLGSVNSRLMHSSPVLLALPPRGYHCPPDARVTRLTAAYGGSESPMTSSSRPQTSPRGSAPPCGSPRSPSGHGPRTRPARGPRPSTP